MSLHSRMVPQGSQDFDGNERFKVSGTEKSINALKRKRPDDEGNKRAENAISIFKPAFAEQSTSQSGCTSSEQQPENEIGVQSKQKMLVTKQVSDSVQPNSASCTEMETYSIPENLADVEESDNEDCEGEVPAVECNPLPHLISGTWKYRELWLINNESRPSDDPETMAEDFIAKKHLFFKLKVALQKEKYLKRLCS